MSCTYAQDFIYKGVAVLDNDGNKCRLRNAKDVARVILAKAHGWNSRNKEVMSELAKKGFFPPFDSLKLESHLLMDDFVESSVVVSKTFPLRTSNSTCAKWQYSCRWSWIQLALTLSGFIIGFEV